VLATVHPWVGMCSVIESPVDTTEEERPSGLILKHEDQGYTELKRGVIVEIAAGAEYLAHGIEALSDQDVIYYHRGYKIGEIEIVRLGDIIAYEKADGS